MTSVLKPGISFSKMLILSFCSGWAPGLCRALQLMLVCTKTGNRDVHLYGSFCLLFVCAHILAHARMLEDDAKESAICLTQVARLYGNVSSPTEPSHQSVMHFCDSLTFIFPGLLSPRLCFFVFVLDKVSCSPDWSWTRDLLVSNPQVLGFTDRSGSCCLASPWSPSSSFYGFRFAVWSILSSFLYITRELGAIHNFACRCPVFSTLFVENTGLSPLSCTFHTI